jgi:hypothetical protein
MTTVVGELGLTGLVTSITGLSPVGAAAILAETGDPRRFATGRAVVKHAGLAPREKLSGAFTGRTRLTGQGRPGLRLAAWRAVWGAQRANPVYRARYQHLTSREQNKLTPTQAQTVIAAAILQHLHAVITTGQAWDPAASAPDPRGYRPESVISSLASVASSDSARRITSKAIAICANLTEAADGGVVRSSVVT